jgi:acyl-CoA synthetase (AMP-forming)/AMP-acid ligase II
MTVTPTIVDRLVERAAGAPTDVLLTLVDDDGQDEGWLTASGLHEAAGRVAAHLLGPAGLQPGDRVMLVYLPSLEFVTALVGCLMAGVVAVPIAPPDPIRPGADLARFATLARNAGARYALTHNVYHRARTLGRLRNLVFKPATGWPELNWLVTDALKALRGEVALPRTRPQDLAILQYTSGSTGTPRGVMITHGNLTHQLDSNAAELGCRTDVRAVIWVPHFHDFGLISGILSSVYGNGSLWMLSPLAFIRRPALWFEVMSRVGATHTAAPNFAYVLSTRKTTPEQRRAWDLSPLEVMMSAAEPIQPDAVRAFLDAFAPSGLRPSAFCPAYGLAEHTVGVSVRGRETATVSRRALEHEGAARAPESGEAVKTLVGCGRPSQGVTVRVVDPQRRVALEDGRVGEIWVDSPSKAAGYFGLEEATLETFRARLPGDDRDYLRTGDLGFIQDGEIYICGRLKDLIIIRGRNIYPQDIEDSVRAVHPMLRPGGVAAFAVDAGEGEDAGERLVLAVEVRDEREAAVEAPAIASAVRNAIVEQHAIPPWRIVVGRSGTVAKTTSGKVMRRACREAFLSGEMERSPRTLHVAHG